MVNLSCKAEMAVKVAKPCVSSISHMVVENRGSTDHPVKIRQFHYRDLEVATGGFSDEKLLGRGSHGSVYEAVLRGGRRVAVKKLSKSLEDGQEMDNEIEILSHIKNQRLVNLVGYAHNERKDRLLVVEFMCNGTLYDVLHSGAKSLLSWGRRVKLALQVARAIQILHSQNPPIIHRDIKSANVLIDRNFNARLGDFGLALRFPDDDNYQRRSTLPAGTMGYLDPCYITPDNLSVKTDVFSFGILLLEIISGRKAIDMEHSPSSVDDWAIPLIKRGKLSTIFDTRIPPLKDPLAKKNLALIAARCVRSCHDRRPSMKEVAESLSTLSKSVALPSWNGFNNSCMAAETPGHPLDSQTSHMLTSCKTRVIDDLKLTEINSRRQSVRNSRHVHSDLR